VINREQYVALFEHPRLRERMRVSTVVLKEPRSHDIMAAPEACYEAETQIWRGEHDSESLVEIIKHNRGDEAWPVHNNIVRRSMAAAPEADEQAREGGER
jgi:hypothetical protein